jgi:hypothetical protein
VRLEARGVLAEQLDVAVTLRHMAEQGANQRAFAHAVAP